MKLSTKVAESTKASEKSVVTYCIHVENNCAAAMDTEVEGCRMLQRLVGISVGHKMQRDEIEGVIRMIYVLLMLILSVIAIYIACHLCM